jgi:predicted RNA-binding Zn ribbon-like protein
MPGQEQVGQAPGDLAKLQAFVNTRDIEQATDELASPAELWSWLRAAGLLGPDDPAAPDDPLTPLTPLTLLTPADLEAALQLREALRGVLASHAAAGTSQPGADEAGGPAGGEAAPSELGRIAAGLPTRLEVGADGRVGVTAGGAGAPAALARILLIAANAATTGTWGRLKACSADDCQWAFYDRSPTRSGCWCSMRICGSRAKSRAYRRRAGPATVSRSARSAGPGA